MKIKSLFLALLALLFSTAIQAQFSPDPAQPVRVSTSNAKSPKVALAYDGSVFISHVEWVNSPDYFPDIATTGGSAFIRVVHLFADGTFDPNWGGEDGVMVANHITATSDTDFGMAVLKDGSVVILHADARNAPPFEAHNNQYYQVYGYRYTLDGQPIWNSEGVPVSIVDQDGYSELRAGRPKVVQLSDGNLVATWSNFAESNDPNMGKARIVKLRLNDGSRMWEPVNSAKNGIQPISVVAENGGMLMVYKSSEQPYAEKFDKNGDRLEVGGWVDGAIRLSTMQVANFNKLSGVESDGDGGAVVLWTGLTGSSFYAKLQRVDKEAQLTMGPEGLTVSDEGIHTTGMQMAVNAAEKAIYVAYQHDYSETSSFLILAKVDYDGNIIWKDTIKPTQYNFYIYGVVNTGTNVMIFAREVYSASAALGANAIFAYGYSYEGEKQWETEMAADPEGEPASPRGQGEVSNYAAQAVIAYEGGGEDKEFAVAQNINREGKMGADAVSAKKPILVKSSVDVKTYPNPVENILNINVNVKGTQAVTVKVMAIDGTTVATLAQNQKISGERSYVWTPSKNQKGLYFVTVVANGVQTTKKIVVK